MRRPRVADFLDGCPSYPATLLVAPAGSGKTAAAAAYTERAAVAGTTVTWLRPDRHDVIAAEVEAAAELDVPPVLVLDDAHLLCAEGTAVLAGALADRPGSVRLLLLARRELAWVPMSAVLAGDVRTLPPEDLRFTPEEAAEVVRLHFPAATEDDVAAVLDQAGGWGAALVLSSRALAATGGGADVRVALAASRRPMLDYLAHEVVESLSPELVRVLLTTCRLDHVTADDAVLLSGLPSAAELLDQAAAAGLLVTAYRDRGRRDWRYHPMLRDLLRRRTERSGPDWSLCVDAHHRAVAEYADRRDAERAILHARLSDDLDLQLRMIREFAADLIIRRRPDLVAEALAAVPADIRSRHHELLVLHATVLRAVGEVDAAKIAADRALAADARHVAVPVSRDVETDLAALDLWQARYGWRAADPAIARAEQLLGCRHAGKASAHDLTGIAPVRAHWLILELAAFQTWLGDLDAASIHLQDAAMYAARARLAVLEGGVLAHRALLEMVTGAYQSARDSADAALAVSPPPRRGDVTSARAHLARGWAQLHALEMEGARASLARFDETPLELLDPLLLVYGRLFRACVLSGSGELAEALRLLDHRGDVPTLLPPHVRRDQQMVRLLLQLSMGDRAGLERLARDMQSLDLRVPATLANALHVGLAGEEARAVQMLDSVDLSTDGLPALALTVAVVRTGLLHRSATPSGIDAARESLPELVSRAAAQRLHSTLALGALISPGFLGLLDSYARSPEAHPFTAEARAVLYGVIRPFPEPVPPRRADGTLVTPLDTDPATALTRREREVLEHLALGGGNADLARSLFVSENTVKTHLASIYRKLNVDRRVDALRAARARGLL